MNSYKVHQTQLGLPTTTVPHTEVVPLRASLRVNIVLHIQLVGRQRSLRVTQGHQQITTLERTVKGQPIRLPGNPIHALLLGQTFVDRLILEGELLLTEIKEQTAHDPLLAQLVHLTIV
jgi:hypothetical protein